MFTFPDLAPFLAQIDHHALWWLGLLLLRPVRALLIPLYRLYVLVLSRAAPTISKGVNCEIEAWFASRQRRRTVGRARSRKKKDTHI